MVGVERPWEEEPNHVALAHLHVTGASGCDQHVYWLSDSISVSSQRDKQKERGRERDRERERERARLNQQNKMYNINTA